jgi:hypothetical protein
MMMNKISTANGISVNFKNRVIPLNFLGILICFTARFIELMKETGKLSSPEGRAEIIDFALGWNKNPR